MSEEEEQEASRTIDLTGKKPGCLLKSFIVGAAMIAGAAVLMNRWDHLVGAAKAGSVVLIVVGVILASPFTVVLGFKLWLKHALGSASGALTDAFKQMADQNKRLFGTDHEFRDAAETDFDGLNPALYDEATMKLEALGYRRLGDIVDKTIEEVSHVTIPIRVMASPNGDTSVGLYQFRAPEGGDTSFNRDVITCDFESEFTDGSFVCSGNTRDRDFSTPPPMLHRRQYDLETPIPTLAAAHAAELEARRRAKPEVLSITVTALADVLALQRRLGAAKRKFREETGYLDSSEVQRVVKHRTADKIATNLIVDAADEARRRSAD